MNLKCMEHLTLNFHLLRAILRSLRLIMAYVDRFSGSMSGQCSADENMRIVAVKMGKRGAKYFIIFQTSYASQADMHS
jgi:hypothetical protein